MSNKIIKLFFLMFVLTIMACDNTAKADELIATMQTSKGKIVSVLFYEKAPLTVSNFVGLATGKFAEENSKVTKSGQYYDGLTFHRVVPDFVIQGGDPSGDGTGGPGYQFLNEIHPDLLHDKKGILSMANAGKDTNGSQFFITLSATPHLDGGYNVFGRVKEGIDVVEKIKEGDVIKSVTISAAKNSNAEKFLKEISWKKFQALDTQYQEDRLTEQKVSLASTIKSLESETPPLSKTKDGIFIQKIKEGSGANVKAGDTVETHYELKLYGGQEILDSSFQRNQTFEFTTNTNSVIKGWDIIVQTMRVGEKLRAVIPPDLGYGSNGIAGTIPGNAFLDFTIELVSVK